MPRTITGIGTSKEHLLQRRVSYGVRRFTALDKSSASCCITPIASLVDHQDSGCPEFLGGSRDVFLDVGFSLLGPLSDASVTSLLPDTDHRARGVANNVIGMTPQMEQAMVRRLASDDHKRGMEQRQL